MCLEGQTTMPKHQRLRSALLPLASLVLAACLGYRTPMVDPNKHVPAVPTSEPRRDAAADLATDVAPDRAPDLAPDRAPDHAPDLAPDLATDRSPDLAPDRAPDLAPDRAPDLAPDLAPDRAPDFAPKDTSPDLPADAPTSDARTDALATTGCAAENRYVLLFGDGGQLYRFDANTLALTTLATVACGSGGYLNSMTVSPIGPAYISNSQGDLCSVDMRTFRATRTAFNPLTVLFRSFGMALLPDNSTAGQTLYIAVKEALPPDHLERIDLTTFALSSIGYVTSAAPLSTPTVPSAELTAGPSGELYGFAVGTTESLLLNIDPQTAIAIDVTKVPAGFTTGAFALVYWQDYFYLFLGSSLSGSCTVYRYHKGDAQVVTVGTLGASIIGAGVACANP
jgi:hypothetical protein